MRNSWRKGCALLLVGAMIATALAMVSTPAKADSIIPSTSRFRVRYNPAVMAPPTDAYPPIYEKDTDGSYFLLGEGDGLRNYQVDTSANTLRVNLTCMDAWQCNLTWLNITNYDAAIFDFADADPSNMEVPGGVTTFMTGAAPWGNGTAQAAYNWSFDVLKTSGLGADISTEITLRIQYAGDPTTAPSTVPDLRVRIYLSSIFDDPASITHENPPNVNETATSDNDVMFEAGDKFVEGNITFHNFDNAVDGFFTDLKAVLTVPTTSPVNQITCFGSNNEAKNTSGLVNGGTSGLKWRFSIASGTLPGIYPGTVAITYTRTGRTIDEGARVTNWTIDYNFRDTNPGSGNGWSRDQCWASSVAIVDNGEASARGYSAGLIDLPYDTYTQSKFSDKKLKVNVTIMNNGNSPIYRVEYRLNINNAWIFFRDPTFFYTEVGTIDYDRNVLMVDSLAIGTSFNMTIEVVAVKEIPVGEHRLPINYTGYYYNNGSLMTSTGYEAFNMTNPLTVMFSIMVVDGALDSHWTRTGFTTATGGNYNNDLTELTIYVNLTNDEGYAFMDIMITADFTGTPFYNPLVTERATRGRLIEARENPVRDWAAGATINVTFIIDMDPTAIPDRYRYSVNITAIVNTTLAKVSTIVTPEISVIGYGPRISIEAFTAGDITPGLDFPLTLTIRNDGDDSLRDGWVFIDAYSTEFEDWFPICDFISQIQRNNASYYEGPFAGEEETYGWDGAEVTLQQLDIDSAKEIIELNLYMNGVYNHPSARITMVRLREPLAPGATVDVSFTMLTDKDMVKGKPYTITVYCWGKNSEGGSEDMESYYEGVDITVRTKDNGQSYQGVEWDWFSDGMKFFGLFLFLVIIIVILLMVFRKKGGKAEEHTHAEPEMHETPPAN